MSEYKKVETRIKHDSARKSAVNEIAQLEKELALKSPFDSEYGEKLKRCDLLKRQLVLYDREMGYIYER